MESPSIQSDHVEILLVDDNPGDVRLVKEAFTDARIANSLHTATTGQEALDFLHQRGAFTNAPQPDLVLLDWRLPQMTGEPVLREVRHSSRLEDIPVIVLTGFEIEEDFLRGHEPSADAYLTKPVDADEFIRLVRSFEYFWLSILCNPLEEKQ